MLFFMSPMFTCVLNSKGVWMLVTMFVIRLVYDSSAFFEGGGWGLCVCPIDFFSIRQNTQELNNDHTKSINQRKMREGDVGEGGRGGREVDFVLEGKKTRPKDIRIRKSRRES